MNVRRVATLTPAQFLAAERSATGRHELVGGQLLEMPVASRVHNLIAVALAARLHEALAPPWHVYVADAKVRVSDDFYYPDVVISKEAVSPETCYLAEPSVVVEITSPATEARDRLEKRLAYQRLPSLQEYVLASQGRHAVEVYRRRATGWEVESCGAGETMRLCSLAVDVALEDLYRPGTAGV